MHSCQSAEDVLMADVLPDRWPHQSSRQWNRGATHVVGTNPDRQLPQRNANRNLASLGQRQCAPDARQTGSLSISGLRRRQHIWKGSFATGRAAAHGRGCSRQPVISNALNARTRGFKVNHASNLSKAVSSRTSNKVSKGNGGHGLKRQTVQHGAVRPPQAILKRQTMQHGSVRPHQAIGMIRPVGWQMPSDVQRDPDAGATRACPRLMNEQALRGAFCHSTPNLLAEPSAPPVEETKRYPEKLACRASFDPCSHLSSVSVPQQSEPASTSIWEQVVRGQERMAQAWSFNPPCPLEPSPAQHAGDRAEEHVAALARELGDGCSILRNIRVPLVLQRGRREIDQIFFSPSHGIICIEVKHWSGRIRCEHDRWFQYHDSARKFSTALDPQATSLYGALRNNRAASSSSHPYWREAARPRPNPVSEIKEKAELVRSYLQRNLPSAQASLFIPAQAVQGIVVLTSTADVEFAPSMSEDDRRAVVQSSDVPAFLHSVRDGRSRLRALADRVLPQQFCSLGVSELMAAHQVLDMLGTWDTVVFHGGRTFRGDLRLDGSLSHAIETFGGRRAVGEVLFRHVHGSGLQRLRRVFQAAWRGHVSCSLQLVRRRSSVLDMVSWKGGSSITLPETTKLRMREAGKQEDTVIGVDAIETLTLSPV